MEKLSREITLTGWVEDEEVSRERSYRMASKKYTKALCYLLGYDATREFVKSISTLEWSEIAKRLQEKYQEVSK